MSTCYIDIAHAPNGTDLAGRVQALIKGEEALNAFVQPWASSRLPRQADLYVLVVPASDDLADQPEVVERIAHAEAGGFPIVFVVSDKGSYNFRDAPLDLLREYNAEGLDDPERLLRTMMHHAGLRCFENGGRAFISYGRKDGSKIAETIRRSLNLDQLFGAMDVHEFAGGELIQDAIADKIRRADLVLLIDTQAADESEWVAEEVDLAVAARVPVLAVTPTDGWPYAVRIPRVSWDPTDVERSCGRVVEAIRRELGRRLVFRTRVERTLRSLARVLAWTAEPLPPHWNLRARGSMTTVGCSPDRPQFEDIQAMLGMAGERGLLVAGSRPVSRAVREMAERASKGRIAVAHLAIMASRLLQLASASQLEGKRVFLSAAMPSDEEEKHLADRTLHPFVVTLTQAIVELGGTLVFGGHPSITPLVHEALQHVSPDATGAVELHQARLWQDSVDLKAAVRDGPLIRQAKWHGDRNEGVAENIAALRDGMIDHSLDASVFVGGKTDGFKGPRPGIIDEFERFQAACPGKPAFRLGLAGGAARTLPREDGPVHRFLRRTPDPDLAVALIVAELLGDGSQDA